MKAINNVQFNNFQSAIPNDIYFDNKGNIYIGKANGTLEQIGHSSVKNNLTTTTDPTSNDDASKGYSLGSAWFNKNTGVLYFLQDITDGAAVWVPISSGGGSTPTQVVLWGATAPSDALGVNGNGYMQVIPDSADNGKFYTKSAGTWGAPITQFGTSN